MKTMNQRYAKTEEILKKFKKADKLYRESALFNRAVQVLVDGVDVYDLLGDIIEAHDTQLKAMEQYMMRDTRPYFERQ